MIELQGIPKTPGIVIATIIPIDVSNGLSGVPQSVLSRGLKALKMGLIEADWTEVVIACDLLAVGSAIRIPGVRTVGIAAQGNDEPALPLTIPCVTGISNLMQSVQGEQIAILDANQGTVYIDPDVQTFVRYQSETSTQSSNRIFLESAHIPAKTLDGRVVLVMALAASVDEVETAINQGADALIVQFDDFASIEAMHNRADLLNLHVEAFQMLLALSAGKKLYLILDNLDEGLLSFIHKYAASEQVSFLSSSEKPKVLDDTTVRKEVVSGANCVVVTAESVARVKEIIRTLPELETLTDDE
ncbi:MAG TPA: hypothetical protein PLP86_01300 [Armatimonadota bacterium]|nr:hypothetical protein [Armatimonadota bacterium]